MNNNKLQALRKLHGSIYEFFNKKKIRRTIKHRYLNEFKKKSKANPHTVFLVLTPQHNNIGDHAIAYAETRLLNKLNIDYVEITGSQLYELKHYNLLGIMNKRPILFNGGGYLGTLWFQGEQYVREIVSKNPKSNILCFPNTIFYESSSFGENELNNAINIYNKHNKLYFYAREETSYNFMKKHFKNVKLVPDIVLSLDAFQNNSKRSGCILCLRNDKEKTRTQTDEESVVESIKRLFGTDFTYTDMLYKTTLVSTSERFNVIQSKLEEFSKSNLIITDRLHAMIFAAITETPCIVINSMSPKVKGCFEWLKNLGYIRFVDDLNNITTVYNEIMQTQPKFTNIHLMPYYNELKSDLINIIER